MRAINSHFMSDTEGNDVVIADAPVMPESSAEVDMATGEMGVEGLDLVKLAAEAAEEHELDRVPRQLVLDGVDEAALTCEVTRL